MIPILWLAKNSTCARCRDDEAFVERLISGRLKRPGDWFPFQHITTNYIEPNDFAIVCFPAGAHSYDDAGWLNRELNKLGRVILFLNSDECQDFPIDAIRHPNIKFWVMLPRPEKHYPPGTMFLTEGGRRARSGVVAKEHDWFFAGQINNSKREEMWSYLSRREDGCSEDTGGFLRGDPAEYLISMARAKVAPAPAGICSQSSFRCQEALSLGCVPVVDALRADGHGRGFWNMVAPGHPFPALDGWGQFDSVLEYELRRWPLSALECHSWWHLHRRSLAMQLARQVREFGGSLTSCPVTAIIPTSPIPSHPSTKILEETVASIRERLDCEIIVTCDGVRAEQVHLLSAYQEYVRSVMILAETWDNVTPIFHKAHLHQAEMLRRALQMVETPYILYVEHDAPLVGEIPFDQLVAKMELFNIIRLYHEAEIQREHLHLMVDEKPHDDIRRVMQWSQRPHLARTNFYRRLLKTHFAATARTMIEDVLHGCVEHDWFTAGEEGWSNWKIGVYEPEGNIMRSSHLDGRGDEPKYPMSFRYPSKSRPLGTPSPASDGS